MVLIVATVGVTEGFLSESIFSVVVLLVIVTSIITPPVLRSLFEKQESEKLKA